MNLMKGLTWAQSESLRSLAGGSGVYIGSCSNSDYLQSGDVTYSNTIGEQYDLITPENSCKWSATEPEQAVFVFEDCDYEMTMAESKNQVIRGHNLCWGKYNPSWLEDGNFTGAELESLLRTHIDVMMTHYQSRAFCWDVVNEAISDSPDDMFGTNVWYPALPNYVDIAFEQAAASRSSPDVKLFYNDYMVESSTGLFAYKADKMYNMVKSMKERKIPIDGVGLQFHIDIYYSQVSGVRANMERLGELGLDVHITELDVGCGLSECKEWGEEQLQRQAEVYGALVQACLDVKACTSFETWGFTDLHSWRGVVQHPLPFDENYATKLAYQAIADTLQGNSTWVDAYYERHSESANLKAADRYYPKHLGRRSSYHRVFDIF